MQRTVTNEDLQKLNALHAYITAEVAYNRGLEPSKRIYTEKFKDYCLGILLSNYTTAVKTFQDWGLPSMQTIINHRIKTEDQLQCQDNFIGTEIPSVELLNQNIALIHKRLKLSAQSTAKVTVSADALYFIEQVQIVQKSPVGSCKLKGVVSKRTVKEEEIPKAKAVRAGFVFLLNFVDTDFKPQLLYFHFQKSGSATETTLQILTNMKTAINKTYHVFVASVSDADSVYVSNLVTPQVLSVVKRFFGNEKRPGSHQIYHLLNQRLPRALIDRYHILKRVRCYMLHSWLIFNLKEEDLLQYQDVFDLQELNDIDELNWLPEFLSENHILKLNDYIPIRMLNPQQAHTLLEHDYLHQAIILLMIAPLFVGLGSGVESNPDLDQIYQAELLHLSVYSFYVCILLYQQYQNNQVRAANVGFANNEGKVFKGALPMDILEHIIIWCVFLFQETSENQFTQLNSISTYNNEKYNGRIRFFSHGDNSSIKAEAVAKKFITMDYIEQKLNQDHFKRRRQYQHIVNITGQIIIDQKDQDAMYELACRTVRIITDNSTQCPDREALRIDLVSMIEELNLQNFVTVQLYRESKRTVKKLTRKNGLNQGIEARMKNQKF
ncbi:Conserved_hypothetical protein [Hexamita inflata]|uniref:Uncharacterized protein n=1 Tax=Hexamita inflata TaxID=28002 RepID=A0AA86NHR2_9EUKA|nr:Conserved hypothetical protein [Hexamita inflata]